MKSCAKVFASIPRSKLIFPELRRPFVKGSNYQLEPPDLYWKFGSIPKINSLEVIKPTAGTADQESLDGFFCYKGGTTCERAGVLACCSKALSKFAFQFSSG